MRKRRRRCLFVSGIERKVVKEKADGGSHEMPLILSTAFSDVWRHGKAASSLHSQETERSSKANVVPRHLLQKSDRIEWKEYSQRDIVSNIS